MTPYQDSRYRCPLGCGSTCTVTMEIDVSNHIQIYCPHCRHSSMVLKLPKPIQPPSQEMKLPSDVAQAILDKILEVEERRRMAEIDYLKKGVEVADFVKGVFVVREEELDEESAMEIATWFAQFNQIPTQGMTKFTIGFIRGLRTKKNNLLLAEKSQVVESD